MDWDPDKYKRAVERFNQGNMTPDVESRMAQKIREYEDRHSLDYSISDEYMGVLADPIQQLEDTLSPPKEYPLLDEEPTAPVYAAPSAQVIERIPDAQDSKIGALDGLYGESEVSEAEAADADFILAMRRPSYLAPQKKDQGFLGNAMDFIRGGHDTIEYWEPTLEQVQSALSSGMSEDEVSKLTESSGVVQRFKDARYKAYYDWAERTGRGIKRMEAEKEGDSFASVMHNLDTGAAAMLDSATFGGFNMLKGILDTAEYGKEDAAMLAGLDDQAASALSGVPGFTTRLAGAVAGGPMRLGATMARAATKPLAARGVQIGLGGRLLAAPVLGAAMGATDETIRQGARAVDPVRDADISQIPRTAEIAAFLGPAAELIGSGVGKAGAAMVNKLYGSTRTAAGDVVGPLEDIGGAINRLSSSSDSPTMQFGGPGTYKGVNVDDEVWQMIAESQKSGTRPWGTVTRNLAASTYDEAVAKNAATAERFEAATQRIYSELGDRQISLDPLSRYVQKAIENQTLSSTGEAMPFANLKSWQEVLERVGTLRVVPKNTPRATTGDARRIRVNFDVAQKMLPPSQLETLIKSNSTKALPPAGLDDSAAAQALSVVGGPLEIPSMRSNPRAPYVEQIKTGERWREAMGDRAATHDVEIIIPTTANIKELDRMISLADNEVLAQGKAVDPEMAGYQRVLREIRDKVPETKSTKNLRVVTRMKDADGVLRDVELRGYSAFKHIESRKIRKMEDDFKTLGIGTRPDPRDVPVRPGAGSERGANRMRGNEGSLLDDVDVPSGDKVTPVEVKIEAALTGKTAARGPMTRALERLHARNPEELAAIRLISRTEDAMSVIRSASGARAFFGFRPGGGVSTSAYAGESTYLLKGAPLWKLLASRGIPVDSQQVLSVWRSLPPSVAENIRKATLASRAKTPTAKSVADAMGRSLQRSTMGEPGLPGMLMAPSFKRTEVFDEDLDQPTLSDLMILGDMMTAAKVFRPSKEDD